MYRSKMSLALGASIYSLSVKISTITHTHGWKQIEGGMIGRNEALEEVRRLEEEMKQMPGCRAMSLCCLYVCLCASEKITDPGRTVERANLELKIGSEAERKGLSLLLSRYVTCLLGFSITGPDIPGCNWAQYMRSNSVSPLQKIDWIGRELVRTRPKFAGIRIL